MAISENVTIESWIAGSTFASTDLYKFVVADTDGHVVIPNTTSEVLPIGVLYGYTQTTSTDSEVVPVATFGVAKVRMAASTLAAGGLVGASTAGLGVAPTTKQFTAGVIKYGSSGSTGRIASVQLFKIGSKGA